MNDASPAPPPPAPAGGPASESRPAVEDDTKSPRIDASAAQTTARAAIGTGATLPATSTVTSPIAAVNHDSQPQLGIKGPGNAPPKLARRGTYCRWSAGAPCIGPKPLHQGVTNHHDALARAKDEFRHLGLTVSLQYKGRGAGGEFVLHGRCQEKESCEVVYHAHVDHETPFTFEARCFGEHEHEARAAPGHGRIFNVAQLLVARKYADIAPPGTLSQRGLLQAFQIAGIAATTLPSAASLANWVKRENWKRRLLPVHLRMLRHKGPRQ